MAKKSKTIIAGNPTVINPMTDKPITLTPEIIKKASELFRSGITDNSVANILGVNPKLFREWLIRGGAYGNGLHGELFVQCAKAVGYVEFEMLMNIRKHAMGSPAEHAYSEITHPDGRVEKKVMLDAEGKPVVLKPEVPPNPQWAAWILEKRFKKTFGRQAEININSIIDENPFDAALNNKNDEEQDVSVLSTEEEIKVLQMAIRRKQGQIGGE